MPTVDPTKTKSVAAYKHAGTLYALARNGDGTRLYAGSSDYGIHVFAPESEGKDPIAQWTKHDNYVTALAYVPAGVAGQGSAQVVSGSYDRQLIWWNAESGEVLRSVEAHAGWLRDVALLPGGKQLASVGDDMLVKLWDAQSGDLAWAKEGHAKRTPQGHVTALYAVAASPDGKHLASGDRIGDVRIWEVDSGKQVQQFQVPVLYTYDPRQRKRSIGGIRALCFSPEGNHLAVGGIGQVGNVDGFEGPPTVEVWDWRKPGRYFRAEFEDTKGIVNDLAYHPPIAPLGKGGDGGGWLVGAGGGSGGAFLAFWKAEPKDDAQSRDREGAGSTASDTKKDPSAEPTVTAHRIKADGHIHRFCFNPAGDRLYAAGHEKIEVFSLGV